MKPRQLGPITLIEWVDHASLQGEGWQTIENAELLAPVIVRSVGWVLREDKYTVVLVPHRDQENTVTFGEICIVRKAILSRKKLRG